MGPRAANVPGRDGRRRPLRRRRRGLCERRRGAGSCAARAPARRSSTPRTRRRVHELLETVDLHHGRNWIVEVAVWDLLGRARGEPVWRLLGGERDRILAYASSGELVDADERVRRCAALRDAGVRAVKLRLHSQDWRLDLPVIEAVRERVPELEIMVDANQGWRMPGDLTPRWDVRTAERVRRRARAARRLLARGAALRTDDVDGYAALAAGTDLRLAAGELVRTSAEAARSRLTRGGVDVVQPDVVLVGWIRARATDRGARRDAGSRVEPAHVVERVRAAREPARRARVLDVPLRRGPVRPAGVVGRAPRLAPPGYARDRGRRDDRAAARPWARRHARLRRARAIPDRLTEPATARAGAA